MLTLPKQSDLISRREAILRVSSLLGGVALVGGNALLTGCVVSGERRTNGGTPFTQTDMEFLDEVADTILPDTNTPGAKAAGVGAFMAVMVTDAYTSSDQQVFRDGIVSLDEACQALHSSSFMSAVGDQRLALLETLDREQFQYMSTRADGSPAHYFRMMKELALLGYFTSEIGYKQAMRYIETPGRFDPCVPYSAGEKSWAPHA